MNIAEQLTLLAELARVEAKLKDAKERLDALPKKANEARLEVVALEKKITEADVKREAVDKERRQMEHQLTVERDQLKKWNARADKIKDEREHGALVSEISTAKRAISHLENDILEKMEIIEGHDGEMKKLIEEKKKTEAVVDEELARVKDDMAVIEAEVATIDGARAAIVQKLPDSLVKKYQRIAEKKGQGVAIVAKETCLACKRTIPPQLHIQLYKGAVLETCPSCSRILVHEVMTHSGSTEGAAGAA